MVLESLIGVKRAEKKPYELLLYGMAFSAIATMLALIIFQSEASLVLVFLTVLACLPLVHKTFKYEESKGEKIQNEYRLLGEHWKALKFLILMFIGFVIAMSVLFVILPYDTVNNLFTTQLATIDAINNKATTGSITNLGVLGSILLNNFRVLLFTLIFSLFYGAGAIFILTWNASVISAAIGTFVRNKLSSYALMFGFETIATYLQVFSIGLLRYLTHGIFEILAYFIAGLAGGIIGIAIINRRFYDRRFKHVMLDGIILMFIAVAIIVFAGVIEVYVTPALIG